MTVSFLFGWQHILVGLVLLVVLAVVFFLVLAAGRGSREEWQATLEARSTRFRDVPTGGSSQPVDAAATETGSRRV